MVFITYNIYEDTFQAKNQPLTPNIIQIAAFFTHPYAFAPHTQFPIYLNRSKATYDEESMLKIKNFSNRSQTNGIYHW